MTIPQRTILLEEVAFRGALLGLFRQWGPTVATVVSPVGDRRAHEESVSVKLGPRAVSRPGVRTVLFGSPGLAPAATAVLFFCLSLTPSLLPRPWLLQGAVSGVLTATGYGIGVLVGSVGSQLTAWRPAETTRRRAWKALGASSAVIVPASLYLGSDWQRQIHQLMGQDPPSPLGYLGALVVATAFVVVLLLAARILVLAVHGAEGFFGRWIPAPVARVVGAMTVLVLFVTVANGFVANVAMRAANASFKALNDETDPDTAPPDDRFRSGSPESLVSWESLGRHGRRFVLGAPSPAALARFNGGVTPTPPIRVYVGLDSAPTTDERARLAVLELERTGAFDRSVLSVLITTGMGWIDRRVLEPLEYMYNGDTAMVTIQYSYLPSFLSFVFDGTRVRQTGRELFNAVYARWSELPPESRPKLLVAGKSLGALGAEAPFSGLDDIRNRTDGMLLVGAPNAGSLRREFTRKRDTGTPEVRPVFEGGETVRFATRVSDLAELKEPWSEPRVVYLQHPSDPAVWWSPALILGRPAWLRERRGSDVHSAMRWLPFVTFTQVTADLVFSLDAPPGHGHNYGTESAVAWAAIVPPAGWTAERTDELRAAVSRYR